MADVLVAVMPFAGHVTPALRAVEALVAAGHSVRVYTGAAYASAVDAAGALPVVWRAAPDFDEHDLPATFPQVGRRGPRGVLANLEHVFIRTGVGQVEDLVEEFGRRPWDVLVSDSLCFGGGHAAERLRTPWATLSVVPLVIPSRDLPPPGLPIAPARGRLGRIRDAALRGAFTVLTRPLARAYRETRQAVGLDPGARTVVDAGFSPFLVLALGVADLEPPRSDLPPQVHFVGAFPPKPGGPLPPWWDEALTSGRPLVHVTQGTLNIDPADLLRPALTALGSREVTVAATTGLPGRDALPFPVPANAHVAGRLPYAALLPRLDAMVTNGGWGGVLAALAHGVPLVVAGGDLDKPAIAALVARSGAGIDLRTGHPSSDAVGRAVDQVLAEPRYRHAAGRLAGAFAAHDPGAEVVALLERLLRTRQAVRRERDAWGRD
ncbi:glycosyltransferase [Amnibacterium sp. CER49]|uniref:glycosyltransferase n=1 Tax=Amnibacterium sp. CER49 TaxID=3039161 RepID=UPI00244ABBE5|nr:glycosyltransferase [Amnibacterium sp. CER49]MDH2445513.1 glycosyltransferase [Amnibacterium sp. CER49]